MKSLAHPGTTDTLLRRDSAGRGGMDRRARRNKPAPDTEKRIEVRKAGQLRILTPLHSFEPGGVERIAIRLHRKWCEDGVDSVLILGRRKGRMRREFPGLTFRTLAPGWFPTARWETLWLILMLPGIIRRVRPDAIFCPGNTYAIVMIALKWLMRRNCPPVLCKISNDLHRQDLPPPFRWLYHKWLKLQAHHIDGFVALAPAMGPEIRDLLNIGDGRVHVIEDPALSLTDLKNHRPESPALAAERTRYLAIGRLVPQKNFALLLKAYAKCRMPGDRLTILGDGPQRARLEKLATQLGIASGVFFEGHQANIAPYLASADALVLSSDYEGVPAVVLEALAAGLPTVATDCCASMRSLISNPAHGIVVATGDCEALSKAMQSVRTIRFDHPAAREMLRSFTLDHAAPAYLAAFKTVCERSGASART